MLVALSLILIAQAQLQEVIMSEDWWDTIVTVVLYPIAIAQEL